MVRKRTLYTALVVVLAVVVAGGWLFWQGNRPATAEVAPPPAELDSSGSNQVSGVASAMPDTAAQVQVQAWFPGPVTASGTRTLNVRLHVADGWHVNANPASLDFLIPTTVEADADSQPLTLETSYPSGKQSDVRLGDTVIKVYENNTIIRSDLSSKAVTAAEAAGGLRVSVTAQACSDKGICLPPSVMKTRVPLGEG